MRASNKNIVMFHASSMSSSTQAKQDIHQTILIHSLKCQKQSLLGISMIKIHNQSTTESLPSCLLMTKAMNVSCFDLSCVLQMRASNKKHSDVSCFIYLFINSSKARHPYSLTQVSEAVFVGNFYVQDT